MRGESAMGAAQGGGRLEVELARNWEPWHPAARGGREGGERLRAAGGGLPPAGKKIKTINSRRGEGVKKE